jgi:hypothetical protein
MLRESFHGLPEVVRTITSHEGPSMMSTAHLWANQLAVSSLQTTVFMINITFIME